MNPSHRVFVAGHRGLVGSAIVRRLRREGFERLILRTRAELDLRDAAAVRAIFEDERPDYVILAAARVGGILANDSYPVDFIRDNLSIQLAVLGAAHDVGVEKLLFLGSSCVYPKHAPQPIKEEYLLTGPLEPTNQWYAVAKISGLKQCQAYRRQYGDRFITVMPTNLYGPGDNFDLAKCHVLPALMRKVHEAKESKADRVVIWGAGSPRREFMHVDDMADACVHLLRTYDGDDPVNVGVGCDLTITQLAEQIREVVGFEGRLEYDRSKPDGTPRKLLDVSRLSGLGWTARIPLSEGLESTYRWYLEHVATGR